MSNLSAVLNTPEVDLHGIDQPAFAAVASKAFHAAYIHLKRRQDAEAIQDLNGFYAHLQEVANGLEVDDVNAFFQVLFEMHGLVSLKLTRWAKPLSLQEFKKVDQDKDETILNRMAEEIQFITPWRSRVDEEKARVWMLGMKRIRAIQQPRLAHPVIAGLIDYETLYSLVENRK